MRIKGVDVVVSIFFFHLQERFHCDSFTSYHVVVGHTLTKNGQCFKKMGNVLKSLGPSSYEAA